MKAVFVALLVVGAVLLVACENNGEETPQNSGIEGQVLIGPMCPVVREGTPCPDEPYQATVDVWNAARNRKVQTFTTDEDGRFRIALAPGEYYIDPQTPQSGGPPTPAPQTVTVPADRFVQISLSYDSGIR